MRGFSGSEYVLTFYRLTFYFGIYVLSNCCLYFAQPHDCVKAEKNVNKTKQIVVKAHLSC